MFQERLDQWRDIENISQQMRDVIKPEKSLSEFIDEETVLSSWDEIAALDVKRMQLLEQFFSTPFDSDEAKHFSPKLHHVLELNKELADMSRSAQNLISEKISNMGQQQRASAAYTNCL